VEVAKTFGSLRCRTKLLASSATQKISCDKALAVLSVTASLPRSKPLVTSDGALLEPLAIRAQANHPLLVP